MPGPPQATQAIRRVPRSHRERILTDYLRFIRSADHSPDEVIAATLTAFTAGPAYKIPRACYFKTEEGNFVGHMWKGPFTDQDFSRMTDGTKGFSFADLIRLANAKDILAYPESQAIQDIRIPIADLEQIIGTEAGIIDSREQVLTPKLRAVGIEVYVDSGILPLNGKKDHLGFLWLSGLTYNGQVTPALIDSLEDFARIAENEILLHYKEERRLEMHDRLVKAQAVATQNEVLAHSLFNAFVDVVGYTRQALRTESQERIKHYLRIIFNEGTFLEQSIHSLSIINSPIKIWYDNVDLGGITRHSLEQPQRSDKKHSYSIKDGNAPEIYGERPLMRLMAANLKYLSERLVTEEGNVEISITSTDESTVSLIYKFPSNVDMDERKQIFESTFNPASSEYWLAYEVARKIVASHEGTFSAAYKGDQIVFDITLPVKSKGAEINLTARAAQYAQRGQQAK